MSGLWWSRLSLCSGLRLRWLLCLRLRGCLSRLLWLVLLVLLILLILLYLLICSLEKVLNHARPTNTDIETQRSDTELCLEREPILCRDAVSQITINWDRILKNRPATSRTALLSFQPASKTRKMQNMSARELLRTVSLIWSPSTLPRLLDPRLHVFAANDADSFPFNLLRRRIGIPRVHVCCCPAVPNEIADACDEGTQSEVDVADNVQRKAVPAKNDPEEGKIGEELEEVCGGVSISCSTSQWPTGSTS